MKFETILAASFRPKAASFKLQAASHSGLPVNLVIDQNLYHQFNGNRPEADWISLRVWIVLLFTLLIATQAYAQFSVGLRAGLSVANTTVDSRFEEASKGGLAIGVTTANTLGKNISLLADLMYVQKGYNHQICNQCYDKFTATFIEIPIAFRYSFYLPKISPKLENLKAHVSGGLYLAQWLNAEYETKIFDNRTQEDFVFTGEKRMDFGPNFGAGLEYMLFSGSLVLDGRYSLGTVDMSKPGSSVASKNKSWIISLSWLKSF